MLNFKKTPDSDFDPLDSQEAQELGAKTINGPEREKKLAKISEKIQPIKEKYQDMLTNAESPRSVSNTIYQKLEPELYELFDSIDMPKYGFTIDHFLGEYGNTIDGRKIVAYWSLQVIRRNDKTVIRLKRITPGGPTGIAID